MIVVFPHVPDQKIGEIDPVYFLNPTFLARQKDKIVKRNQYPENMYIPLSPPQRTSLSRPNLIGVEIRTLVNLRNAEILQVPIGQIETETLSFQCDAFVVGVVPLLRRKVVVTGVDLHWGVVTRIGSSVEAKVCARQSDLCRPIENPPILSASTVAIVYVYRSVVFENCSANV